MISVASGSVVTATKGGKSVTGTAVDGVCVLVVPEAGVWTVSAAKDGKTTPAQTIQVVDQYAAALEYGTPLGELAVGSSVYLNIDGVRTEFLVVNQGKPGSMYDDSCAGTWLLMKKCYAKKEWHSKATNDYANSDIHSYLNSTFLSLLDSGIRDAIKQVKIPYRAGSGYSKTVTSGASGLAAKIFLLSANEVAISDVYTPTNEGTTLSYFSGCVANGADAKRVAILGSAAVDWWLRSPYCNSSYKATSAGQVGTDGSSGGEYCTEVYGIRPALVLPSTLLRSDDGTNTISA